MKYTVETTIEDKTIKQQTYLYDELSDIRTDFSLKVLSTEEEQIKEALIKLGWTPPKDNG